MDVVFERLDARRYSIGIVPNDRYDVGADVPLRGAPGQGRAPHDLVHFVVEEQAELRLGIYGQVAAGGEVGGFFRPAPDDRSHARDAMRSKRLGRAGRDDCALSEQLAALVNTDGAIDRARAEEFDPDLIHAIELRLGEVLRRWDRVQPGGRLILTWRDRLTIRHGRIPDPVR